METSTSLLKQIQIGNNDIEGKETIFFAKRLKMHQFNGNQIEVTIVCTLYHINIFKYKQLMKSLKFIVKIRWDEIISLQLCDQESFIISTNMKVYQFSNEQAIEILARLAQHIKSIIPKEELPNFSFSKSYLQGYKIPKDAIKKRILFLAYITERELPAEFLEKIDNLILLNSRYFPKHPLNLGDFSEFHQFIDLVLDGICFFPSIHRILVPKFKTGKSLWNLLATFIKKNQAISTFESYEPITSDFKIFLDSLTKSSSSKIRNIGFYENDFDDNFVLYLSFVLEKHSFLSLAIVSGLTQKGYEKFKSLLPKCLGFQGLQTLSLSGCKYIKISDILNNLHNLKKLVMNCILRS